MIIQIGEEIIEKSCRILENIPTLIKELEYDYKRVVLNTKLEIHNYKIIKKNLNKLIRIDEVLDSFITVLWQDTSNLKVQLEKLEDFPHYSSCLGKNLDLKSKHDVDEIIDSYSYYLRKIHSLNENTKEYLSFLKLILKKAKQRDVWATNKDNDEVLFRDYQEFIQWKIDNHYDVLNKSLKLDKVVLKLIKKIKVA